MRLRPGQAQLEDDGREKDMTAERAITEWCKMTQAGWPGWLRWQVAPPRSNFKSQGSTLACLITASASSLGCALRALWPCVGIPDHRRARSDFSGRAHLSTLFFTLECLTPSIHKAIKPCSRSWPQYPATPPSAHTDVPLSGHGLAFSKSGTLLPPLCRCPTHSGVPTWAPGCATAKGGMDWNRETAHRSRLDCLATTAALEQAQPWLA